MDNHQSIADDASFVVLGLGSMPPASLDSNSLSEQRALDSITSYDYKSSTIDKLEQLIRENNQLRDALNQNNLAMKTQFESLSKWQQEVSETHRSHKQKFEETKALVIKLKAENSALRNRTGKQFDDGVQSEIFSLQRQNDQLKAEKLVLVKERDSFREECTKLNFKISDLETTVRSKTEELDGFRQTRRSGENNRESMKSWMYMEGAQPRHPLSIEVDNPPVPDVHSITLENERLTKIRKSLQDLQEKYDNQSEEMKKNKEEHTVEIDEKNREVEKMTGEMQAKEAFLKTTISELLLEKEKNQQLTAQCEKLSIVEHQVELYKNDYEEERAAREKLADEKETLAIEIRRLEAKISELESRSDGNRTEVSSIIPEEGLPTVDPQPENDSESQPGIFVCPLCTERFIDFEVCQEHVNECLDKPMRP